MLKALIFTMPLAIASVMTLASPAAAEPGADSVVARVNGEDITLGQMIVAYAGLPDQYQQLPAGMLFDAILDQLIQQSALAQSRTAPVPKTVEVQLQNERRSLLAADALEGVMASAVSEADIKAAYDAQYADGTNGQEYNASHILVETEDEAKAIVEALRGGADFATLAKEKSTGPSGPGGGELGWFGVGAMVPEFEAAVVKLAPGEISEPVQTQFGWHVIKLNDTRVAKAPPLEQVHDEIANRLRREAAEARIAELTAAASIEKPQVEGLDPEMLRNLGILEN